MKIILMRHGEAERQTQQDSERQLTEFGKKQATQTAQYILDKYSPDLFVVSPYDRAQQTLEAYIELAKANSKSETPITVNAHITPSDDAMTALKSLADIKADCVLIVCHMPIIAKLTGLLTGKPDESYALAEARVIDAEFIAMDQGTEVDRFVPIQE